MEISILVSTPQSLNRAAGQDEVQEYIVSRLPDLVTSTSDEVFLVLESAGITIAHISEMSFFNARRYARPILEPLIVDTEAQSSLNDSRPRALFDDQSVSSRSALWTSSKHIFSGTSNRVTPSAWKPEKFNEDPSAIVDDPIHNVPYDPVTAKQRDAIFRIHDPAGHISAKVTFPVPKLVVKRYLPTQRSNGGLTLLILPGMGSPKELFEPMIDVLLGSGGVNNIAEIWSVDLPLSGQTPLVNPTGYAYGNEKDVARDLMLFVTSYLPVDFAEDISRELVPRRFASDEQSQPVRQNLHVIGHSLGAQSAILIAAHAPDLFASITAFDPAMIPAGKILKAFTGMPKDALCTGIPRVHPSRAELAASLEKNKRVRGWDERVKRAFVRSAVVQTKQGSDEVMLTAHPRLEWALYYDQETPTHCYDRLTDLTTPLNMVVPERPFAVPPKMLQADMAQLKQRTRLTFVKGATHQLPLEKVEECARLVAEWLEHFSAPGRSARL